MNSTIEAQLEALLRSADQAEGPAQALRREIESFDTRSIVLFGAGSLGKTVLAGLRRLGIEPLAFADNNPKVWGTSLEGLKVVSLDEAVKEFGSNAPFVVTIYTGAAVREQLRKRGLRTVPFAQLLLRYPAVFLPHAALDLPSKIYENATAVRAGLDLWADEESRIEYVAQVRFRLFLDERLPASLPPSATYFPQELIPLSASESFVDCGAFDGDSVRSFLRACHFSFGSIIAVEPDPQNCQRLRDSLTDLKSDLRDRIKIFQNAVGAKAQTLQFEITGTAHTAARVGATYEVKSVPLDDLLRDDAPTYIKMDVEGAEPDVVRGASAIIRRHKPVLAICLYHQQDHLWSIPLMLRELNPTYKLYLRRYSDDCWEQVCYAIPQERS